MEKFLAFVVEDFLVLVQFKKCTTKDIGNVKFVPVLCIHCNNCWTLFPLNRWWNKVNTIAAGTPTFLPLPVCSITLHTGNDYLCSAPGATNKRWTASTQLKKHFSLWSPNTSSGSVWKRADVHGKQASHHLLHELRVMEGKEVKTALNRWLVERPFSSVNQFTRTDSGT